MGTLCMLYTLACRKHANRSVSHTTTSWKMQGVDENLFSGTQKTTNSREAACLQKHKAQAVHSTELSLNLSTTDAVEMCAGIQFVPTSRKGPCCACGLL
jgi:hypothetical protein